MPLLEAVAPGLLVHAADVRFYGVRLQSRMAVVALPGGALLVHSPLPLRPEMRAELDATGRVAHVVSPNKIHNQGLTSYAAAFPDARIHASPGLPERRPDVHFDSVLGDAPDPAWADVLDQTCTRGNVFFSEVVFLHRPSRTLIVADLVENIGSGTVQGVGRLLSRAMGLYHRCLASPEHRLYTDDAEAARAGLDRILAWDFDRILLAHGDGIERDARRVFADLADGLVAEVRRRPTWRRRLYTRLAEWQ